VIVAGTNVWPVHSLGRTSKPSEHNPATASYRLVIAVMPKAKGDPYFVSARSGPAEIPQGAASLKAERLGNLLSAR